jgi:two-component system capsular synthesis sensor histidine kinase RcsC
MRDAAIESARLKTLFLATMSHEIRTPLHIIMTNNHVIERHLGKIGDDSQARALQAVRTAGKRLTQTIDHVLEMSRLEVGEFEVNKVAVDVVALTARLIDEFGHLATEKGLKLSWESDQSKVVTQFDEYCLAQALSNLLENAIKFTERGAIRVRLFSNFDNAVRLEVCDTGIGIDEEFIARVFEPFAQEDPRYSRRFEGAGLGLALTKRYLALNAADISVASKKGVGTTFQIRFAP